ncbi:hypothetical protein K437DRAFT_265824 [Tilletiaria anomala UBC 951]|uniref:Uncharacterized protein n=1 Tax=Tilletiaria anomala (strain ATCC 24038 / CBS 436.72 / UBC 951) TaxID=1037660 RepID=A0A066WHJ4_TILAU|nr:uncharacterized protein K437DRAFT_265824 [Tilletiaria anomala UBC 951]KDN53462.1 hypothetical protein K437DRAFT_265824 [Tilletiaria anomala UBC 951]
MDFAIEASDSEAAAIHAVELIRMRDASPDCHVGLGSTTPHFNLLRLTTKEVSAYGVLRYNASCFEVAIDLLNRQAVDLDNLATDGYLIQDAEEDFLAIAARKGIKSVVGVMLSRIDFLIVVECRACNAALACVYGGG